MQAHPNPRDRHSVQQWAQSLMALPNFYVLDTETTGVGKHDEIVQIGVIDKHGEIVMDTLVKATIPVPYGAMQVHGISDAMLADAPTFADVYVELSGKLAGTPIVAYNMPFDWRLLQQTSRRWKLPMVRCGVRHCAMRQYATFRGVRGKQGGYRWHKLTQAAADEQLVVKDAHSALGDVRMTLALIQRIAQAN